MGIRPFGEAASLRNEVTVLAVAILLAGCSGRQSVLSERFDVRFVQYDGSTHGRYDVRTGLLTVEQARAMTETIVDNEAWVEYGEGLLIATIGGLFSRRMPNVGRSFGAVGAGHAFITIDAMDRSDYVTLGEVHVTEFFDHGTHAQMVTERFAPGGRSMGRSVIEDCRTGG